MRTLVVILVILAVGILGVAFYQNWIVIQTDRSDEESTTVQIKVDQSQAREDIKEAVKTVEEAAKNAREQVQQGREQLTGAKKLTGEIMEVDLQSRALTIKAEDQVHELRLAADAIIQRGQQPAELESLRPGDRATVHIKERDGATLVESLTVEPPE
jgi:Cu/Ag efflux protein CusF